MGAGYGVARALGLRPPMLAGALGTAAVAMLGANVPMAVLGVSDPRRWAATDWASDVVPHLAYGLVTAWAAESV